MTVTANETQSNAPLRLAVVGCTLGRVRYGAALTLSPAVEIVALVDADPVVSQVWAREMGRKIPQFATLNALLAEREALGIEAALVSASLPERPVCIRALSAAGLPLLCEIPLAPTLEAIDSLIAQTPEPLLMPLLPRRFDPHFQQAAQIIASGTLGELKQARCHWSFPVTGTLEIEDGGEAGDGTWNALLQYVASQTVDMCRVWLGEAMTVSADVDFQEIGSANTAQGRRPQDSALANLIVSHTGGNSTHHLARSRSLQPDERYVLVGSQAQLELIVSAGATAPGAAPLIRLQRAGLRPETLPAPPDLPENVPAAVLRVLYQLQHFADCVRGEATPLVTAQEARQALEVVHAAYLSTRENAKITLPLRRALDATRLLT